MKQLIKLNRKQWKSYGFVLLMCLVCMTVLYFIFKPANGSGKLMKRSGGLNTLLPAANTKSDSAKDKMSFYAAAYADSVKRMEQVRMDPNRQVPGDTEMRERDIPYNHYPTNHNTGIEEKVRAIQRQLAANTNNDPVYSVMPRADDAPQVKKQAAPDPEMEAINSTLDKLMALQHPQSGNVKKGEVNLSGCMVSKDEETDITFFGRKKVQQPQQSFYSDGSRTAAGKSALSAIVVNEQQIQNGATVKLELGNNISVGNVRITSGTPVYGIATIEGERLHILIPSIRYGSDILPVSLSVYDMDGLEGIYIPGSLARDVMKESSDNLVQSAGVAGFGLSLTTQAAAAGIGAAKNLFSKKLRQVRVTVSAGYRVLLRDNKQMNN